MQLKTLSFKMKNDTQFSLSDIISQSALYNYQGEGAIDQPGCK